MSRTEATARLPDLRARAQDLLPGCAVVVVIALAASAIAARYDAPVMLFALLLGMAMSFLGEDDRLSAGIRFAAATGLKLGVALMGLRVSFDLVFDLGAARFAVIVGGSAATLLLGLLAGRALGFGRAQSLIAAGAVAICGASAALALASVTREFRGKEDHTLLVIITATALSTFAMVFYPVLLGALGFSLADEGVILGASIHDVAQVIGAGFSVSDITGETATLAKMTRVALLPAILLLVPVGAGRGAGRFALPWFVLAFVALMALNQVVAVPVAVTDASRTVSTVLLICAVAALGLNSAPRKLLRASGPIFALMSGLSLWLLAWAAIAVWLLA
ncbi:YeiH family protein [Actibacterium ureilyticum]|uniref:YeiH family protein n=1 Tax=Actibacterium ureilyticum TaxID=1590614 RepID=UPI0015959065|nr:putative sulfate exporter family transporter [Actibacterium ureilyticum]